MQKEDCIFCKLANGEIPTTLVYETDRLAAFNENGELLSLSSQ